MTLTQLRYLVALADHLHFGRAAAACRVSQPTLSAQIKKLEAYLDAPLGERGAAGVGMTALGANVVERARRVIEEAEAIVGAAKRGAEPMVGPRRLGVIPTLCPYFLPWALPAIRRAHPKLDLICSEDLTDRLIEKLRARQLDWAAVAEPIEANGLELLPLFDEPFLAALPETHPLAAKKAAAQKEFVRAKLLLLTEGNCLRDQALALCAGTVAAQTPPRGVEASATGLETLRGLVAAGLGVTLMPALAARPTTGVVFKPLAPPAGRRVALAFRSAPQQRVEARMAAQTIADAFGTFSRAESSSGAAAAS